MQTAEDSQRSVRVKRIAVNTRVSGKFGDFIPTGEPGRRKRARIYGTIIEAIDTKRYKVLFDNNSLLECYSNSLKVESLVSLPPDLPVIQPTAITQTQSPGHAAALPAEDEASEQEHMPDIRPEDDEVSEAQEEDPVNIPLQEPIDRPVGAIPTVDQVDEPAVRTYHRRKIEAQNKIHELLGKTVREKSKNQSIIWTVIEKHEPLEYIRPLEENQSVGWKDYKQLEEKPKNIVLASLFLDLMFKDKDAVKEMVAKMNHEIERTRDAKVKLFSPEEFLVGLGLIIGAAEFDHQGKKCWINSDHFVSDGSSNKEYDFSSLVQHPNFDRYMPYCRFKDFRRFLPTIWYLLHEMQSNLDSDAHSAYR